MPAPGCRGPARSKAHRPAIGLQGGIAARTEKRRRLIEAAIEAAAILRVGQKVMDDMRGVGVDAVAPVP